MKLYDYSGVIHFHSEYSHDGRISIPDIIKAARENGIDFLMLTDHENRMAADSGQEGWHGNTLLIVGEEISPLQFNHFLVFGLNRPLGQDLAGENYHQELIDSVRNAGGIGLIAHPDHLGTEMFHVKQYSWKRWDVSGYTGMSIWDFMTDWQATLNGYWSGFLGYFFPAFVLKGPMSVTLDRWDELNEKTKVIGFGELDNHDSPMELFGRTFSVFPFSKAFRFVRTHIVTESPLKGNKNEDIRTVYNSFRAGRAYATLAYFESSKGFELTVSDKVKEATMGDDFVLEGGALLKVKIPREGRIRIIKDGILFAEAVAADMEETVSQRGIYRVEVFLKRFGRYRPWIFSNPIYLK